MNKKQLEVLKEYIDAVIHEKIAVAFGRDSLHEGMAKYQCEDDLYAVFGLSNK